jgi:hypothetical protein
MAWFTGHAKRVRTQNILCKLYVDNLHILSADRVRGLSADMVRRCGRGFTL